MFHFFIRHWGLQFLLAKELKDILVARSRVLPHFIKKDPSISLTDVRKGGILKEPQLLQKLFSFMLKVVWR
jgi:hypothetical protein